MPKIAARLRLSNQALRAILPVYALGSSRAISNAVGHKYLQCGQMGQISSHSAHCDHSHRRRMAAATSSILLVMGDASFTHSRTHTRNPPLTVSSNRPARAVMRHLLRHSGKGTSFLVPPWPLEANRLPEVGPERT